MQSSAFDIQGIIERLERRRLDGAQPPVVPIWGQLDATCFVRVCGLAAFWEGEEDCRFEQYMEDLVTGFHGQRLTFAYLILGQRDQVQVYVGLQGPQADVVLATALRGTFPAIELGDKPAEKLGSTLRQTSLFRHLGRLTGVPTLKAGRENDRQGSVQQIERLVHGLYGEEWGYLVLARPIEDALVSQMAYQGFEQIRQVSALVKKSVQIAPGTTSEQTDRQAEYCVELLEKNLERLNRGKAQGMWQVEVYFFAASEATLDKAKALLKSIFTGEDSVPDPLRTFKCSSAVVAPVHGDPFTTLMNSYELSILTQLPREEMSGYVIRGSVRVLPSPVKTKAQIFLSYTRLDEDKVENLYKELSDAGFTPWMDRQDILPGERWKSSIRKAIRRSDFFVVCLSANSVNKRGFLQKEISYALGICEEMLDSDIYLIPVRLEDCEVPENLCDFQWVNLFEEDGWAQLIRAIQAGMKRREERP